MSKGISTSDKVQWLIIFLLFFGGLVGFFYGLWLLVGALIFFCYGVYEHFRNRRGEIGWENLKIVQEWERSGGPRPPEEVFVRAADSYMFDEWSPIRKEDLDTWRGVAVPADVAKYIKSENEIPR